MTLYEICSEVAQIEEGLAYGEIEFVYGKLASAMKPGHPADLLDDVLSMIGWDVFADKEVEDLIGAGASVCSLGPRILRTETAGFTAASLILYQYGQME